MSTVTSLATASHAAASPRVTVLRRASVGQEILMGVFFVIQFRTLAYVPGFRNIEEVLLVLSLIVFLIAYPMIKGREAWKFTGWELFVFGIFLYNPTHMALAATSVFGQPFLYGFLSQRGNLLLLGWLVFFGIARGGRIELRSIHAVLLALAWIQAVINLLAITCLDPSRYVSAGSGFVTPDATGTMHFRFAIDFIIYGVSFYVVRGIARGTKLDYVKGILLYGSAIGSGMTTGRMLTISMGGAILYRLIRARSLVNSLKTAVFMACGLSMTLSLIYLAFPHQSTLTIERYLDAYKAISGASAVSDDSANARILESTVATQYFLEHPMLGNGYLSHQWHGGFEDIVAHQFSPDDIGLLGMLFCVGILGTVINLSQLYLMKIASRRRPRPDLGIEALAASTLLIEITIISTTSAVIFWAQEISLFYTGLLFVYAQQRPLLKEMYATRRHQTLKAGA